LGTELLVYERLSQSFCVDMVWPGVNPTTCSHRVIYVIINYDSVDSTWLATGLG